MIKSWSFLVTLNELLFQFYKRAAISLIDFLTKGKVTNI